MSHTRLYQVLRGKCERTFHGTIISEGTIWEGVVREAVSNALPNSEVYSQYKITLNNNKSRKYHKVDMFIKDDGEEKIRAYNLKSKSFNNTISGDALLKEYKEYEECIRNTFPGYDVSYEILKDGDISGSSMKKYTYLNENGILVHNIKDYLKNIGISYDELDSKRIKQTVEAMIKRGNERGITFDEKESEKYLVVRIPY